MYPAIKSTPGILLALLILIFLPTTHWTTIDIVLVPELLLLDVWLDIVLDLTITLSTNRSRMPLSVSPPLLAVPLQVKKYASSSGHWKPTEGSYALPTLVTTRSNMSRPGRMEVWFELSVAVKATGPEKFTL